VKKQKKKLLFSQSKKTVNVASMYQLFFSDDRNYGGIYLKSFVKRTKDN